MFRVINMNVNISINIRNKMKNHKYHTLGTRPKSYQEIVEKGKNKVKVF